ncbi:hypothetical protein GpartN1_g6533.t1 [Galdieria partita]|uniref:Phosphoglycerate mutase n=1 Tax=Galdieria partita TaxID=83374 RepID=A0A9C7Q3V5_9RHOD|nr:hypothetical protein GpartN1_g6533.t1 [Galdieria partita]
MESLGNSYYALRHGESRANVEHLIVSDSENGILDKYGLTDRGKQQAQQAAFQLKETLEKNWNGKYNKELVTLITSPFSRARETAEIIATQLQLQVIVEPLLRERYFGQFNMTCDDHYKVVWNADKQVGVMDPEWGVESVQDTLKRSLQVINRYEQISKGHVYVLVSHGDVLQILRTYFAGVALEDHRSLPYLGNAQIDCLYLAKQ